ncbi:HTH_XRE domain containing protein [uncultured Caudovirales phage]|uniref:HTH_XRE domain containing protein n=1 Tax=uncultured Caudovirales phage TaxID=2100421 RepID=A0A6J5MAX1_9CAUD|nr:HTH_XRE domain containing protein [uncultured Caudovirales phage]
MRLDQYLRSTDKSASDFARQVGVGRMTVHRWLKLSRYPRPDMMARIADATGGAVTAGDFLAASREKRRAA